MGVSGSSTQAFARATEALIVLYTGSKFLAMLRALGALRALLLGGRVAGLAGGAGAGGGLLGGILGGLGVGAAAAAANSQGVLTAPQRTQS